MLDVAPFRPALADFARRWQIAELSLFGSALRDDFGPDSDVDVLVTFEEGETWSLLDLVQMKLDLEDLFGRSVDVVEAAALRNPVPPRAILESCQLVDDLG